MRFQVGELITVRRTGKVGFIIDVGKANSGSLTCSRHSDEFVKNSTNIYYVCCPGVRQDFPLYDLELAPLEDKNGTKFEQRS